ncbi:MAG: hypothetical protein HFH36_06565 [Lachnospiraceae bacterium]|nr:hypothetical protein [Lachnospiraceae bacterium]
MSIRPVEFSGVVQRSQDISSLKQNEDNKPMLQQQNVQTQFAKDTAQHMHQVNQANDSDNPEQKFDAREKGSNEYENLRRQKKKKKEDNSGKASAKTPTRGFDMKV